MDALTVGVALLLCALEAKLAGRSCRRANIAAELVCQIKKTGSGSCWQSADLQALKHGAMASRLPLDDLSAYYARSHPPEKVEPDAASRDVTNARSGWRQMIGLSVVK